MFKLNKTVVVHGSLSSSFCHLEPQPVQFMSPDLCPAYSCHLSVKPPHWWFSDRERFAGYLCPSPARLRSSLHPGSRRTSPSPCLPYALEIFLSLTCVGNGHVECVLTAAWLLDVALKGATHLKRKAKGTECSLRLWL